jgi:hypothetical protein
VYRQRALLAFLLMWIVAGTALAALGASAGPCYYGEVVAGLNPYADLLAALDSTSGQVLWARANQYNIWNAYQTGIWYPVAGISAMPSMHVGMAVLWALVAWGRSRRLGFVLACYALVIQIGSVLLGWHYAVDGYVAALVAVALWKAAGAAVPHGSVRNAMAMPSSGRRV